MEEFPVCIKHVIIDVGMFGAIHQWCYNLAKTWINVAHIFLKSHSPHRTRISCILFGGFLSNYLFCPIFALFFHRLLLVLVK